MKGVGLAQFGHEFGNDKCGKNDRKLSGLVAFGLNLVFCLPYFVQCIDKRDVNPGKVQVELGKDRAGQSLCRDARTVGNNVNGTTGNILLCRHISTCPKE